MSLRIFRRESYWNSCVCRATNIGSGEHVRRIAARVNLRERLGTGGEGGDNATDNALIF